MRNLDWVSEIYINCWTFWKKDDPHSLSLCEIIDSQKRGYLNVKNVLIQNTLWQSTSYQVPSNPEICTGALSSCFYIILGWFDLKKVSLSQIWNPTTVFWHIDSRWNLFLHCKGEFSATSSNVVTEETKNFLSSFHCFSETYSKFLEFWGKVLALKEKFLRNYWLGKRWLLKCQKGPVSDQPSSVNMLMGPKHCRYLHDSILILFLHYYQINWVWKRFL